MGDHMDFTGKGQDILCPHCGKKNDTAGNFCCWCGKSLTSGPAEKNAGKKRFPKNGVVTLVILVAAGLLLAGLFSSICLHDWVEASCELPEHCSKCEKNKGEALGHDWKEATCTVAQSCRTCLAVKGTPLGHEPGEESRQLDP